MKIALSRNWQSRLSAELSKHYINELLKFISKEREKKNIYPPNDEVFSCFNQTKFHAVKIVLVGQDPYCLKGQAHGLAFSVPNGVALPGSLYNIYRELHTDLGIPISKSGCLLKWAQQGVLLLNSVLTVEEKKPGSHFNRGWENFTDSIIKNLSKNKSDLIFLLWGKHALTKQRFINQDKHMVISSSHPSDKSAHVSFLGSRPFSKINMHLKLMNKKSINWNIS